VIEELIAKMISRIEQLEAIVKESVTAQKAVLTFEQAREYLGISESQLYKLTSSRKIPNFKPGGKMLYFRRMDLDNWMLSNRRLTGKELKAKALGIIR
jgi:excisionase family DNA binding protein